MFRIKPLLFSAAAISAGIALLGVLHHRRAGGRDDGRATARRELAVGFLPVT
jgi:hypothetical protein